MHSFRRAVAVATARSCPLALFFLVLSACSSKVDLGGPQNGAADDSGASPASSATDGSDGSDGSVASNDAGNPSNADAGPLGDLSLAEGYATGDIACTTASDCCVAIDGCLNLALVVGVADEDKVTSLLTAYDQAENQTANPRCTGCIPPPVQVACIQGKCSGTVVGDHDVLPDGSVVSSDFWGNHCGTLPGGPVTFDAGGPSVLGC